METGAPTQALPPAVVENEKKNLDRLVDQSTGIEKTDAKRDSTPSGSSVVKDTKGKATDYDEKTTKKAVFGDFFVSKGSSERNGRLTYNPARFRLYKQMGQSYLDSCHTGPDWYRCCKSLIVNKDGLCLHSYRLYLL
jgi:hypothetical protein